MAFKRNEPGCRCCGFGLGGLRGADNVYILIPGTIALMQVQSNVTLASLGLGTGSRVVGADPEDGKLLIQKTDNSIWSLQAKTLTIAEVWDSSTDIAQHEIRLVVLQKNYGLAAAYTTDSSPPIQHMVVNASGAYTYGPVNDPTEPDYILVTGTQHGTAFVDTSGDLYLGRAYTGTDPDPPTNPMYIKTYKDDSVFATSTVHRNGSGAPTFNSRGLLLNPQHILSFNGIVYYAGSYYGEVGGPATSTSDPYRTYNISSGGEIDSSNELWSYLDLHGDTIVPAGYSPQGISLNNTETNTCDVALGVSGWWRINQDLSINIRLLAVNFAFDLVVTYPST